MPGPWEKYQSQPAPRSPTGGSGGVTFERLPEKPPAPPTPLQLRDQALQEAKARREELQWNAERNPDGTKKPDAASAGLSKEDRAAIAAEARTKLKLIDSLEARSKNGWFATGFGSGVASLVNGTTAADVSKDVETLSAAGALQRVMEMARNNGGKNPLTPLSNSDFKALGESIANLNPTQSDEQFQRNLQPYRDIYRRALKAAEGGPEQATGPAPAGAKKRLRFNPQTGKIE